MYAGHGFVTAAGAADKRGQDTSAGADVFARGFCLPSDNKMTPEQQDIIIEVVRECFN